METVDDILAAAAKLSPEQLVRLRRKLDRLEQKVWEAELERTTEELKKADVTEEEFDRLVENRRRGKASTARQNAK